MWRRPTKRSAEQPSIDATSADKTQQQTNDFDCFIVDASEQDMREARSLRSAMLLPMLGDSTDNLLPAALGMIRKSDHYAMAVQYLTQAVPHELQTNRFSIRGRRSDAAPLLPSGCASPVNQAISGIRRWGEWVHACYS